MKRWAALGLASVIVIACSSSPSNGGGGTSSSSGDPSVPDVPDREIAKKEIGPEGGTLTGEVVTIEVPPGAVSEKRVFSISSVAEVRVGLPLDVQATKPGAYALGPDDVEFAKPVTVRVALDKATVDTVGRGGVILFRSEAVTNDWQKTAAQVTDANEIVATTTHFSWWRDATNGDLSCITNRKTCDVKGVDTTDPTKLPGLDCHIPFTGPGVACKGTGPNDGPPYECRCNGDAKVKKTFQRLPDDRFLMATAKECGGACPPTPPTPACIEASCTGGKAKNEAWSCTGKRADLSITCSFQPKKSATCTCNGKTFAVAGGPRGAPTDREIQAIMNAKCGVIDCRPPGSPPPPPDAGVVNDDWICNSPAAPGDGSCVEFSVTTCRDGHYYDTRCPAKQPGSQTCDCLVDGVVTKTVTGSCETSQWNACGFPKQYGK